jgi:hypothetical protein
MCPQSCLLATAVVLPPTYRLLFCSVKMSILSHAGMSIHRVSIGNRIYCIFYKRCLTELQNSLSQTYASVLSHVLTAVAV